MLFSYVISRKKTNISRGLRFFLKTATESILGIIVAEQKNGLLQQYHTAACLRDAWPDDKIGLRQLPQWMEFHLRDGIEYFLFYTVNLDSDILVDLYEPYIKSGVATRVHFNKERVGTSLSSFALDVRAAILGDCLYRFKNHATWILPSIDIDEYINMKDGSVFEGGKVPEDYLGLSWDAIVKKQGPQPNTVRSMEFNIFRFALVQPGQLEISSVLREPRVQPLCPKFVVNPELVRHDLRAVHVLEEWHAELGPLRHLGRSSLPTPS